MKKDFFVTLYSQWRIQYFLSLSGFVIIIQFSFCKSKSKPKDSCSFKRCFFFVFSWIHTGNGFFSSSSNVQTIPIAMFKRFFFASEFFLEIHFLSWFTSLLKFTNVFFNQDPLVCYVRSRRLSQKNLLLWITFQLLSFFHLTSQEIQKCKFISIRYKKINIFKRIFQSVWMLQKYILPGMAKINLNLYSYLASHLISQVHHRWHHVNLFVVKLFHSQNKFQHSNNPIREIAHFLFIPRVNH